MQALARFEHTARGRVGHAACVEAVEAGTVEGAQESKDGFWSRTGSAGAQDFTYEARRAEVAGIDDDTGAGHDAPIGDEP